MSSSTTQSNDIVKPRRTLKKRGDQTGLDQMCVCLVANMHDEPSYSRTNAFGRARNMGKERRSLGARPVSKP